MQNYYKAETNTDDQRMSKQQHKPKEQLIIQPEVLNLYIQFIYTHKKNTWPVCNSIRTTAICTTKAHEETFKIHSGPLHCNLEKVPFEM